MYADQIGAMQNFSITRDVAKRPSKCRVCLEQIPSKSNRVVMQFQGVWRSFGNGGGTKDTKVFFHPSCFFDTSPTRVCIDCGSGEYPYAEHAPDVCLMCYITSRWDHCFWCHEIHKTDDLVVASNEARSSICQRCMKSQRFTSLEEAKKDERRIDNARKGVGKLIKDASEWRK